jgi:hypothetical protein
VRERAIDANRILTDLLVNFRRIVHRGLITCAGELWYREGLPSDVFRRLVIRKENETPLDRFSGDYEELITYATFRDLADIIAGNDLLRERLSLLEPRDGASLLDRLHELEEMRRSISRKTPATEEETEKLSSFYEEFRAAVKSGRKRRDEDGDGTPSAPPEVDKTEPEDDQESLPEEETLESIFGPDEPSKPTPSPGAGRLVVKVSSDDLKTIAAEPDSETELSHRSTTPITDVSKDPDTPTTDVSGAPKTPTTDVTTVPHAEDEEPAEKHGEPQSLEQAIERNDDAMILKALHVEVTELADGMLRREPKDDQLVWQTTTTSGWFDAKTEEYGLQTLEIFYTLADEYLEAYRNDAKASDLKKMLSEAEFSKLLLALREMFLDSRSRAP